MYKFSVISLLFWRELLIYILLNRAVLMGIDDDGPLNNVGQSENV